MAELNFTPLVSYSASEIPARVAHLSNAYANGGGRYASSRCRWYPPAFIAGGSGDPRPEMLILDGSTSGVDPGRRGYVLAAYGRSFSRQDKVTIFISTHFYERSERCDRMSRCTPVKLASGTPQNWRNSGRGQSGGGRLFPRYRGCGSGA